MHDNDPEVLELEKKRNLTKIQHRTSTPHEEAATGWNEHIATTSEAFVKVRRPEGKKKNFDTTYAFRTQADRVTLSSTQEMQQKTIKYVHSRHSAVSEDESTVSGHEAEKVPGPLGSAPANEGKKKD